MALTHCEADPEIDQYFPHEWRAWVRIETIDGKNFRSEIINPKGDPLNPLSSTELREKFQQLTNDLWSQEKQNEVAKCCSRFGIDGTFDLLMQVLTVQ
jgi:2-methylcitrate dehydratase PrpD